MCKTPRCRNNTAKNILCGSCLTRNKRKRNPVRYAYDALKANCTRRKGAGFFELTFEEFKQFATETNYIAGKGRSKTGYTIDRVDNDLGYFIGNIRVLTNSDNARKRNKVLVYDWESGGATVLDSRPPDPSEDMPF